LVDGGQFAPRSGGSGSGDIFINAKWSFNANGLYQFPLGFEVGGNVFGRQGYPLRPYVNAALGLDGTQRVLVTPAIDTIRLPNRWDIDLRVAVILRQDTATYYRELQAIAQQTALREGIVP